MENIISLDRLPINTYGKVKSLECERKYEAKNFGFGHYSRY